MAAMTMSSSTIPTVSSADKNNPGLWIPGTSPLGRGIWEPVLEDQTTQSFSYYLPYKNSVGAETTTSSNRHSCCFTKEQLDRWFQRLHPSSYTTDDLDDTAWTSAHYQNKKLLRQTAWCVFDENCCCEYGYSDTWQPILRNTQMKDTIQEITDVVSRIVGKTCFNSCNLNYYPQGGGVGFHADDEFLFDGLSRSVTIVSLSLAPPPPPLSSSKSSTPEQSDHWGARKFQIRSKQPLQNNGGHIVEKEVVLKHGDLLTMEGMFQKHYLHSVWPGDSQDYASTTNNHHPLTQGERINLTWRTIVKHLDGSPECRGITCPLVSSNLKTPNT